MPTYDQVVAYAAPSNWPAFTVVRDRPFADLATFKNLLATMQAGDWIHNVSATGGFTISGEFVDFAFKNPTSVVRIDLGIGANAVKFTGTPLHSNLPAVYIHDSSNLFINGGDVTNPGGSGIGVYGGATRATDRIIWYNVVIHDVGAHGVAMLSTSPSGTGGPAGDTISNCDFHAEISNIGTDYLVLDGHGEKGTGIHCYLLADVDDRGNFLNNRVAGWLHDCPVGNACEQGQDGTGTITGTTTIFKIERMLFNAQNQVGGCGIVLWGNTPQLGCVGQYIEATNLHGRAVDCNDAPAGRFAGWTVVYGRGINCCLNPNLGAVEVHDGSEVWDTRGDVVYLDIGAGGGGGGVAAFATVAGASFTAPVTSLTPTLPANVGAGDLLVLAMQNSNNDVNTTLPGWTLMQHTVFGIVGTVWVKLAATGELPPTITFQGPARGMWAMYRYTLIDQVTPINKSSLKSGSTANATSNPITPDRDGCTILQIIFEHGGITVTPETTPIALTARDHRGPDSETAQVYLSDYLQPTHGAVTLTATNAATLIIMIVIAINGGLALPVATVAPSVTGTATVGSTLTVHDGTWTGNPSGFAYQWRRDKLSGSPITNIPGATGLTYVTVPADSGCNISCVVTATNSLGSTPAPSNNLGPIVGAPVMSVLPALTGVQKVGSTLTVTNGTWSDSPTSYVRTWLRDNFGTGVYTPISGASGTTYILTNADDACHIKVSVVAVNAVGNGVAAESNILGPITQLAPTNTVAPVASGVTVVGNFVSVSVGTWTGMGGFSGAFTYQWQRETGVGTGVYTNATGANSGIYTVTQADSGKRLRVNVTGTNDTSAATAVSNVIGPITDAPAPPDPDDGGTPPPDEHFNSPPADSFAIGVYQKLFPVT